MYFKRLNKIHIAYHKIIIINYINYMHLMKYKKLLLFIVFNILCSLLVKYCIDHIDDGCQEKKMLCFIQQNSTNNTFENGKICKYNGRYNPEYPYVICYNYNNQECPRLNCINEYYTWSILILICMYIIQLFILLNIASRFFTFNKNLKNE